MPRFCLLQPGLFALVAITLALAAVRPAQAQLSFLSQSFNPPMATPLIGSFAAGISANGTVLGSYGDSNFVVHGYVRSPNGAYTTLDYPGTLGSGFLPGTYMFGGINNAGDVTGTFGDYYNTTNYFIYHKGAFISPQVAGSTFTAYNNVNEAGQVAVVYGDASSHEHAAIYNLATGSFTLLPDIAGYTRNGLLTVLPDGGLLENVGNGVFDPVTGDQYLRGSLTLNGVTTFYDAPGALDTRLDAETSTGLFSGNYLDANHIRHGVIYDSNDNQWHTINGDPSATYTTLRWGNNDNEFAGYWTDASGAAHSLLVTAVPEPGTVALLGSMGIVGAGFFARRRKVPTR